MLVLSSNEEARRLIVNDILKVKDDLQIDFDSFDFEEIDIICFNLYAEKTCFHVRNIRAQNIVAKDIIAENIDAWRIETSSIDSYDIDCYDLIVKEDIKARDIKARNIKVRDIRAYDINAGSIEAKDIYFNSICSSLRNINCDYIEGHYPYSRYFSLTGKVKIRRDRKR